MIKIKLLIDIYTVLCRIWENMHRLAYTLIFLEGKLGRFLTTFLIWSFLNLLHFERESRFNSDENYFSL